MLDCVGWTFASQLSVLVQQPWNFSSCFLANPAYFVSVGWTFASQLSVLVQQPWNFSSCFLANPAYFVSALLDTQYSMFVEMSDGDVTRKLLHGNPSHTCSEPRGYLLSADFRWCRCAIWMLSRVTGTLLRNSHRGTSLRTYYTVYLRELRRNMRD